MHARNWSLPWANMASTMSFFEAKYEYSDGTRMPTRAATSPRVSPASPFSLATSQAAATISAFVASCRRTLRSLLGSPNVTRTINNVSDLARQGVLGTRARDEAALALFPGRVERNRRQPP